MVELCFNDKYLKEVHLMKYTAAAYMLAIAIISFLGYCVENIWLAVTQQYINNRNMYFPFLLGYGLAVVGIYLIAGTPKQWLKRKSSNKFTIYLAYFLLMIILVSIGEILLGKTVEYFCDFTYWNYEKLPFHLTKYTSLPTSMGFAGIIEFFMEYLMEPILDKVEHLPKTTLQILAIGFMLLLVGDFIVSFRAMYRHKRPNYLWKYDFGQHRLIHYHT